MKYQTRKDIREEIELLSEALGQPKINNRENYKYRYHMEDAVSKLRDSYINRKV